MDSQRSDNSNSLPVSPKVNGKRQVDTFGNGNMYMDASANDQIAGTGQQVDAIADQMASGGSIADQTDDDVFRGLQSVKPIDSIQDAMLLKSQDSNEYAVVSAERPSEDVMVPGQGLNSN